MIQLIEHFLQSKSGAPDGGEDRIVLTPNFAAVIDGATSKGNHDFGGMTGGARMASVLAEAVQQLPRDADIHTTSAMFTALSQKHVFEAFNCKPALGEDRPNASIVMFSHMRNEIWRIGDCSFAIDDKVYYESKQIDLQTSEIRSAVNTAFLANGGTIAQLQEVDHGRNAITSMLQSQSLFMNNPAAGNYGYPVICGLPVPFAMLHLEPVPAGATITLASDGYLALKPTLAESEAYLASYYKRDPLMIGEHASTKGIAKGNTAHDDRAWLRFKI